MSSRRAFLGQVAGTAAGMVVADRALAAAGTATVTPGASPAARGVGGAAPAGTYHPLPQEVIDARRAAAHKLRVKRANRWESFSPPLPLANDDELLYPDGWASSSKCLPHDALGHPDPAAFAALVAACVSGDPDAFAAVPLGGAQPLRNPQGGLAFEYCGIDTHQANVVPAPAFASAWRAGEMVEVYWMSLLRDVAFLDWDSDPTVAQACADLSALSDYRGPTSSGVVTPDLLFRGPYAGCEVGPFVSQFLLKDIAFGTQVNTQRVRTFAPGIDYLTDPAEWLDRQNGAPFEERVYDPNRLFVRNLRDYAAWVDADPPLQAAYHALSILLQMGAPLDPSNPYVSQIVNQDGFCTFGPVEWFDMIARACRLAHEAVWFSKWRINRVLRPEEFGGRVHHHLDGAFAYPLHDDVLNSQAVAETFSRHGTYLCSQAYPDACPIHPAYPSGHSTNVGATVTMLKAIFDETFVIPDPVEATADGTGLQPYVGPPLTVGGELNKLAFNIGIARCAGGIHWRSDVVQGNRLGEGVSVSILQDMQYGYNEPFTGYSLTRFDGKPL